MKKFEYKQLHDKPLIAITSPKDFAEWMLKTMNAWGAEGWLLMQVTTPQVNNQLTGDLMALGCREIADPAEQMKGPAPPSLFGDIPKESTKEMVPPILERMPPGLTNAQKLAWHKEHDTMWYRTYGRG